MKKFSTLADERHDLLSGERRANDGLRAERARMLQSLERAQKARNAYQAQLARATQERDALLEAMNVAVPENLDHKGE